ncbi:hypothetical protein QLX41_gp136 [Listeria phage LMTA-94]|uniref:Uncharacterized protein n=1 Tax=Listeria phage LMTA-94 TaxID=1486419 RepID=A0A068CCJ0_9CAUD|nr:hypothetical protein QLX41_gp136 [Listeria phage LMTA-94]AID17262.1 hypothetical protein [Listeria phage LMTA-94]
MKAPISECPYCGSTEGYTLRSQARGTVYWRMKFNGKEVDNSESHDNLRYNPHKYAYCTVCGSKLFKAEEVRR